MSNPVKEAIKEFVRLQIFSLITSAVEVLGIILVGINTQDGTYAVNWTVALAVFLANIIASLKIGLTNAVDKYMHEEGKVSDNDTLKRGLSGGI